jgi:hypothetical protein
MNKQEFAGWRALTESSRNLWTEDDIYRLNGRGAFYYRGGEDGQYIRIQKDGLLEAGTYEGAIPHIGEAMFRPLVTRQYKNFSEASTAAMELGGKQFLVDMFRGVDHEMAEQAARQAYEAAGQDGGLPTEAPDDGPTMGQQFG